MHALQQNLVLVVLWCCLFFKAEGWCQCENQAMFESLRYVMGEKG